MVVTELVCPVCGAEESHPTDDAIQIRGNKVHDHGKWWSQCLVCSGGYDKPGGVFTEASHDPKLGWF